MFHYTVESSKNVEETIRDLETELLEGNFGVLWKFDIKAKLQEKGLEFDDDYFVLEVCNPHEAQRILSKNKEVGYFLPCKITVYQEKGTTKIGMPKPSFLMEAIRDPNLNEIAVDVEKRLITCIDKIV